VRRRRERSWRDALSRRLPSNAVLARHRWIGRWLSFVLHPSCWALRRRNVALGAAIGAMLCAVPLPGQSLMAAALAGGMRANVPVAVATTWLSNPLTLAPLTGIAWAIGAWILGAPMPSVVALWHGAASITLTDIWQPLAIGVAVLAIVLGSVTYAAITLSWRCRVLGARRRARFISRSLRKERK
jgi:uncharacterized protein (DUF2062 family)